MDFTLKKAVAALLIASVGTGTALFATGVVQKPEYGLEDRGDWGEVQNGTVEVVSTGFVYNPNSFGLNLSKLNIGYELKMNDILLAEGGKSGLSIPAKNNTTLDVSTYLKSEKVPEWWSSHLSNGEESHLEVPVNLEYSAFSRNFSFDTVAYTDTIETDIDSRLNQSFSNIQGTYSWSPTDAEISETKLTVDDVSAEWGRVTSETTNLRIRLDITNPNSYAIPMPQFTGGLEMNEVDVADWDANNVEISNAAQDAVIQPGETQEVVIVASMDNSKIDEWFVSHVSRDEKTSANAEIKMAFDVAGQKLTFPNDGINCSFSFQTGILVDGQESGGSFGGCTGGEGAGNASQNGGSGSEDGSDDGSGDLVGGLL